MVKLLKKNENILHFNSSVCILQSKKKRLIFYFLREPIIPPVILSNPNINPVNGTPVFCIGTVVELLFIIVLFPFVSLFPVVWMLMSRMDGLRFWLKVFVVMLDLIVIFPVFNASAVM